jgi:hypothetical protein
MLEPERRLDKMREMDDLDQEPRTYPPGFEPPTDLHPPWYAWLLWPTVLVAALILAAIFFRGCVSALS